MSKTVFVAANAEESASASEELIAQAEELNKMVQELRAIVGGSNGSAEFQVDAGHKVATSLQATDHAWHQISGGQGGQKQADAPASADEVIPMGDDSKLSGF